MSMTTRFTAPSYRVQDKSGGVAAVEMALLAPLLVMLLLGAIESAWLLGQQLDVRQAARQGARLAATDVGNSAAIASQVCPAMDDSSDTTIEFSGSGGALGESIEVTVTKTPSYLTSFMEWALSSSFALSSTATFALESSPPGWTDGTQSC